MVESAHGYPAYTKRVSMVACALWTGAKVVGGAGIVLLREPALLLFVVATAIGGVLGIAYVTYFPPLFTLGSLLLVTAGTACTLNAVIVDYVVDWADESTSRSLVRSVRRTLGQPVSLAKLSLLGSGFLVLKLLEGLFYFAYVVPFARFQLFAPGALFGGRHERFVVFAYPFLFREGESAREALSSSEGLVDQVFDTERGIVFGTSLFAFTALGFIVLVPQFVLLAAGTDVSIGRLATISSRAGLALGIPLLVLSTVGTGLLRGRFSAEYVKETTDDSDIPFTEAQLEAFRLVRVTPDG